MYLGGWGGGLKIRQRGNKMKEPFKPFIFFKIGQFLKYWEIQNYFNETYRKPPVSTPIIDLNRN